MYRGLDIAVRAVDFLGLKPQANTTKPFQG